MKRTDIAFAIFLKRLPSEPLTDTTAAWFRSKAEESFMLADVFERAEAMDADKALAHLKGAK